MPGDLHNHSTCSDGSVPIHRLPQMAARVGLDTMAIFSSPPGGFFVFGILMAAAIFIEAKTGHKKERSVGCAGCAGCPSAQQCENAQEGGT